MNQELVRRYYDEALDREEEGQKVDTPYIYSVPKGNAVLLCTEPRLTLGTKERRFLVISS